MSKNKLSKETSPYLLQHANNPVHWGAWNQETLEHAKSENKPLIISIGYSTCHWCHVMEHESFEDDEVAQIMNEYFIPIKVDREERPDVDALYMDAIQAMGIRGGWPLNVIAFPDGRPFYGGTYFPKRNWIQLLKGVNEAWNINRDQLEESAEGFKTSLEQDILKQMNIEENEKIELNDAAISYKINQQKDKEYGGFGAAPKFPMPSVYRLLLHRYYYTKDVKDLEFVKFSLEKIASAGLYDQISGGFARYSVDEKWEVPHFEKMLYDNGQLLQLYSEAYALTKEQRFKFIIDQTVDFIEDSFVNEKGGFFSAYDADSEGEEGKFYVWSFEELQEILDEQEKWFIDFANVSPEGNWEHGKNILQYPKDAELLLASYDKTLNDIVKVYEKLNTNRNRRVPPGLDDKCITSWNALTISGLVAAYRYTGNIKALNLAEDNALFIKECLLSDDLLYRTWKGGEAKIPAFLEDYTTLGIALIDLYHVTFKESYIELSNFLLEKALNLFEDPDNAFFYYSSSKNEKLIARKKEYFDNVLPSSNALMAEWIFRMNLVFPNKYSNIIDDLLKNIQSLISSEPRYTSHWGCLLYRFSHQTMELAVTGEWQEPEKLLRQFRPDLHIYHAKNKSSLSIFKNRIKDADTRFFLCTGQACEAPVKKEDELYSLLDK